MFTKGKVTEHGLSPGGLREACHPFTYVVKSLKPRVVG